MNDAIAYYAPGEYLLLGEPCFQPYALVLPSAVGFFTLRNVPHNSPVRRLFYRQFKQAVAKTPEDKLQHQADQAVARVVGFLHNAVHVSACLACAGS